MTNDNTSAEAASSPSYEPRIVAFLDILGFRVFVSQDHQEAVRAIKAIDDALEHVLRCTRELGTEGWVSIRTFSDCFCVSTEEAHLPTLIDAVAFLQYYLAACGIFVRGGISTGCHCETSQMVFSQGLVHAYDLQSHDPYPRVLVAPEVLLKILPESYSNWGATVPLSEYILVDDEDACFLDYLTAVVVCGAEVDDLFAEHAQAIRSQLTIHVNNEAVYRKHLWLAKYHNFRVREVFDDESDWDPEYWRELMQRLLIVPPESGKSHTDIKQTSFTRQWPGTARDGQTNDAK